MNNNNLNNNQIKTRNSWKQFFKRGYIQIRYNRIKSIIFIIATIFLTYVIYNFKNWNIGIDIIDNNKIVYLINRVFEMNLPANLLIPILASVFYAILIVGISISYGYTEYEENCLKAGIVNYLKQVPIFIRKYKNKFNRKNTIVEFFANGTSYEKLWLKLRDELDSAFEHYFIKGIKKKGKSILLNLTKEEIDNSRPLYWKPEYTPKGSKHFKIPIGVDGFDEPIYWNMSIQSHGLIGGESNSGKSVTLKQIASFCLNNSCDVKYFCFKGGVDVNNPIWKEKGLQLFTTIDDLINELEDAIRCIDERIELFNSVKCNKLEKYNSIVDENLKLKRVVYIFDEAAEFLDKDIFINKYDKEKYSKIVGLISSFAGRARAYGLNMLICTQRPSADIIPKLVRINCGFRACFKADEILSKLTIDCEDAHLLIPKDTQGFCVTNMRQLVKCYYVKNDEDYFK